MQRKLVNDAEILMGTPSTLGNGFTYFQKLNTPRSCIVQIEKKDIVRFSKHEDLFEIETRAIQPIHLVF